MTRRIFATSFLLLVPSISGAADPQDDGYLLFTKACTMHKALTPPLESAAILKLQRRITEGGEPGAEVEDVLKRERPVLEIIRQAGENDSWTLPDITTRDIETMAPNDGPWIAINRTATLQAICLIQAGEPDKAWELISLLDKVSMKAAPSYSILENLIQFSNHDANRSVIVSLIDAVPVARLKRHFDQAKRLYAQRRTLRETLAAQGFEITNNVTRMFAGIRANKELPAQREALLATLRKAGTSPELLARLEKNEVLSIDQWEQRTRRDVDMVWVEHVNNITSSEMPRVADADRMFAGRFKGTSEASTWGRAPDAWVAFMKEATVRGFSIEKAESLHTAVGEAISRETMATLRKRQIDPTPDSV
ncbi:MAG: hypothetical protein U1F87_12125 [Kiritimatiellia bacterium]